MYASAEAVAAKDAMLAAKDAMLGQLQQQIAALQHQVEWFKRQLFGSKSERFPGEPGPSQLSLGAFIDKPEEAPPTPTRTIPAHTRQSKRSDFAADDEGALFFDPAKVPVQTITLPAPAIAGLSADQYTVIGEKGSHRLARRPGDRHGRDADQGGRGQGQDEARLFLAGVRRAGRGVFSVLPDPLTPTISPLGQNWSGHSSGIRVSPILLTYE